MGLVIFKGDTKIGVYNFPDVKRPRLCVEKGNSVTALLMRLSGMKSVQRCS